MITSNLLRGEKVRLMAVSTYDLSAITRWWNDPDFLRLYNSAPAVPRNDDQLSRRFDLSNTSPDVFLFAIRALAEDNLIGLLEFDGVDWSNRTTFVSIGIGDPAYRRQGYGRDAMQVGLRFAFHELNLHRVCLTVSVIMQRPLLSMSTWASPAKARIANISSATAGGTTWFSTGCCDRNGNRCGGAGGKGSRGDGLTRERSLFLPHSPATLRIKE